MSCHRTIIRLSAVLASLALGWACGGDSATAPEPARPTTVTVSPARHELTALGITVQLSAEVRDQNARVMAGATVTWTSSTSSVATVDAAGLVRAVGNGTATITASAGSASGSAVVTVMQSVASVEVSPSVYELTALGQTVQLTAEAFDENGHAVAGAEFSWESSDAAVATVDAGGLVTGVAEGVATITASAGEASGSAVVTVMQPVASVEVSPSAETIELGSTLQLTAEAFDESGEAVAGVEFSWESSDAAIATVDATGLVTGVAVGAATITATAGSAQGTAEITVGPNPDRAALVALYEATDGPNWVNSENWLTDAPLAEWYGVDTDTSGRVVRLDLAGTWEDDQTPHGLRGSLPAELGSLANLRSLNLAINELSGPIPTELGNLDSLRGLSLFLNRLTGPIPRELGNLSNLTGLWLYNNDLAGPVPPEMGALSALEHLLLNYNRHLVGPLPATLTGLTELWNLQFVETGLCAPQTTEFRQWLRGVADVFGEECPIVQGSDRQALAAIYEWTKGDAWDTNTNWLGDGPLDDWYGVSADGTDRVTALDLSDNNLVGILPDEAGDLLYLVDLTLNGNDKLSGELPGRMRQLAFLSTLRLDGTGLCASTAGFRNWLNGISDARVTACPDDHGNDATGATDVSVGQSAEGELESLADEDWFRVEIGGRGTLSVSAEGNTVVNGELYDADGALVGYDGSFGSFSIVRRLSAGTYYVKVTGQTEETRGAYTFVSSFELHPPGVHAYLTQAVQSHDFSVPLVAGEDALLRVFVMADDDVTASMPPVHATFYRGGQEVHSVRIDGSSQQVPGTMAEGDLDATANAVVPGSVLVPGTEMVVEADPDGTLDPSLGIGGRIPKEGRMALDIRSIPDFHVTAVPFLWTEKPDSSGFKVAVELTAEHDLFYETRDWLPVAVMEVSVREAVLVDYDPTVNMDRVLGDIALLRVADGASGYYMGVPPWKTSDILGIAHISGKSSVSRLDGHTIAHEFGHNLSLRHTPCGNPPDVDGRYPHSRGMIGAWGYDFRDGTLVDPEDFTDLMTYCRTSDWISDYSFTRATDYRTETQAAMASHAAGRVLMVRGGVEGGGLRIEPAFVLDALPTLPERAGPYRLAGSDRQGRELFALRFEMQEVADPEAEGDAGFTFAIPVQAEWAEALATITLTGPEGSATLARDDPQSSVAALVLDATTRRIQAILHGSPEQTVAARQPLLASPGTVTLFSRGILGTEAWRR